MANAVDQNNRFILCYYSTGGRANCGLRRNKLKYHVCPNFIRTEAAAMEYWTRFNLRPNGDIYGRRFVEVIAPNAIKKLAA